MSYTQFNPPTDSDHAATTLGIAGFVRVAFSSLRPYWMLSLMAFLTLLPGVAFIVAQPILFRVLIDEAIAKENSQFAVLLLAVLFTLLAVNALSDLAQRYLVAKIVVSVINDLRFKLFTHLQNLSQSFYARSQVAELMAHYTSDLDAIERALMIEAPYALSYLLIMGVGMSALFAIEWRIALLALVLVPSLLIGPKFVGPLADRADKVRQKDATLVTSIAQENLAAQMVVKVFGLQNLALANFRDSLEQLGHSGVRVGFLSGLQGGVLTGSGFSILVLAMTVGVFLTLGHQLTVGALVAFTELLWWVVASLQQLSGIVLPFRYAASGMQRIQKLLAEESHVVDAPDAQPLPPLTREIRFNNVSFSYTGEAMNLKEVNLTIPAGQSLAIVGPSGSGKSTMLSLLLRLYDPTQGSVTIDGYDLRQVSQASLRAQIGVVFQESFLFNTTIRENIRFGKLGATDEEVEAAAKAAEIHDFVLTLPQGYETKVGERGGLLSGGQRQRIAIARAILRNPAILILDEATSALDLQTEAAINETLRHLAVGRTVITITHRLASVVDVNSIAVLEGGRLVEQGTHEQLLSQNGVYYRLWQQPSSFTMTDNYRYAEVESSPLQDMTLSEELSEAALEAIPSRLVTKHYHENKTVITEGNEG